jgi:hypothetical protein
VQNMNELLDNIVRAADCVNRWNAR